MNSSRTVNRQKSLNRMRSLVKQSGGSLIVLTALMFPFLLSFMALSLDIGMIYDVKRRQQKAADSSAMGAGQEIWRQNAAQVIPAGKADAKKNGFDDNQGAVTVNVEYPYAYNGGNANDYVRVTISEVVPTYFARLLGPESATVRSQAVAGLVNFADGCYYVLNESSNQAFKSVGGAVLRANCGLLVNSDNSSGYFQNGGGEVCIPSVGIVGGYNNSPSCSDPGGPLPNTKTGIPRVLDPLAHLTVPSSTGLTNYGNVHVKNGDDVDLLPGYYSQIKQTGGTSRLSPGLYYVEGDFTVNGGVMSSLGDGVTIYLTEQLTINGNAQANLHAPVAGTNSSIPGILFWSPSTKTQKATGNAQSSFQGTLYFKNALLAFRGTNDADSWQLIVADEAEHVGNSTSVNNLASTFPGMPPVRKVTLLQ